MDNGKYCTECVIHFYSYSCPYCDARKIIISLEQKVERLREVTSDILKCANNGHDTNGICPQCRESLLQALKDTEVKEDCEH